MARKFGNPIRQEDGSYWQYYIVTKFAFSPQYIDGRIVWLQRYWETYPVDASGEILAYRSRYSTEPRP